MNPNERGMDSQLSVELSTTNLNQAVALAWNIDPSIAITVSLVVDYPIATTRGLASELSLATIKVAKVEQVGVKKQFKVANQLTKIATNFCVAGGVETPELSPGFKVWTAQHPKKARSKNFLVRFVSYLHHRLSRLHMHCTICDQLQQDAMVMLMPSVCTRTLCMYSWQVRPLQCTRSPIPPRVSHVRSW